MLIIKSIKQLIRIIINTFIEIVPLITGTIYFLKFKNNLLQNIFFAFLIITFINDIICMVLSLNKINNTIMYEIYDLLILVFTTFYTFLSIKSKKILIYHTITLIILLVCLIIYNTIILTTAIYIIITLTQGLSFGYLLLLEFKKYEENILENPIFWISSGVIIYTFPEITILSLAQFTLYDSFEEYFAIFNTFVNLFSYTLFSISFICFPKKPLQYIS